jgi:threonine aldolase
MIDLRSDTCSRPSEKMRHAMAHAVVGDDVYSDDPTVKELEREVADFLGMEDAVYMVTGTMTNQVGIRAHTEPGDAVFFDQNAHVYILEGGAPASLSGVLPRLLPGVRGVFTATDLSNALGVSHRFFPSTVAAPVKLLCLENTHNIGGGKVWPLEQLAEVCALARSRGIKLHLDGARLWHATAATGIPEREYAKHFDTVSVCFSKGLGAPVGSALAGSREFIQRARRFKQQFGGGFRQAGIVAAGALYALRNNRERLAEDHEHARMLAQGIANLPGISLDVSTVETNIVRFGVTSMPAGDFVEKLYEKGLYVLPSGADGVRAIPYLDISRAQIQEAIGIISSVCEAYAENATGSTFNVGTNPGSGY